MNLSQNGSADAGSEASWRKVALWTVLFQLAWFYQSIPPLLLQGAMFDTDDLTRLAQVRSFLAGQGWFDLVNHRWDPPLGADIHWSRLVDLPIAGLTLFFGLFTGPLMAERLAAIVWPTLLIVATVQVIVATCRRLDPGINPLLVVLFTALCLTAQVEFMPGRIDHHGVQILFFCLVLLGLAASNLAWGHFLVGAAASASISVGLDGIILIAFALAWLVLDWVRGIDTDGRGLRRAALGILASAPLLYALNIPPDLWLRAACDANSAFYFTALVLVCAVYLALALSTARLPAMPLPGGALDGARLAAALPLGIAAAVTLFLLYPQCLAGPFGTIPPDLKMRWLSRVSEAKGLFALLDKLPVLWFAGVFHSILMCLAALLVAWRIGRRNPQIVPLLALLLISVASAFVQYRALRIGIFASIPFCVILTGMAWAEIRRRHAGRPVVRAVFQVAVVAILAPPLWLAVGALAFPAKPAVPAGIAGANKDDWRENDPDGFCNKAADFTAMASLPPGLVMNNIDLGPGIIVFTPHNAIGGPYHRNSRALLDILDFFETDEATAYAVAARRKVDYVAFCEDTEPLKAEDRDSPSLAARIILGTEPSWLERLTRAGGRLHVFRFKPG